MATLYITEFAGILRDRGGGIQVPYGKVADQTVAIGGTTQQSSAFNAATRVIRVHTDAICSIDVGGTSPTATATKHRMSADQTEYIGVNGSEKIAVITNT